MVNELDELVPEMELNTIDGVRYLTHSTRQPWDNQREDIAEFLDELAIDDVRHGRWRVGGLGERLEMPRVAALTRGADTLRWAEKWENRLRE